MYGDHFALYALLYFGRSRPVDDAVAVGEDEDYVFRGEGTLGVVEVCVVGIA